MKTTISTIFIFMLSMLNAQSPSKISYQAVIRNASNALVANQTIGMKVSILQESGTVVYSETYSPAPMTNANGLVTLSIGSGTPTLGSFSSVHWYDGTYFLKTEADPAGGTNYTVTGTSQLLSVPYSEFAKGVQPTSSGGSGLQGAAANGLWWGIYEGGLYRGYIGSYAGNNEDVDFGTGYGNSTGSTHLTIASVPKLTVDPSGDVGIGTTTPNYRLQVDGITGTFNDSGIRIQNATANTGWSFYPSSSGDMIIGKTGNLGYFNATTGAYSSSSDERLKTNFEDLTSVLQSVKNLKLFRYEFKNNNPRHQKDLGVRAQDLKQYFPELVSQNLSNDGNPVEKDQLYVNYSGMGVVALKAIQEQQNIIEELEIRIKVLEGKK